MASEPTANRWTIVTRRSPGILSRRTEAARSERKMPRTIRKWIMTMSPSPMNPLL